MGRFVLGIASLKGIVFLYCRRAFACPFSMFRRPVVTQTCFWLDFVTCGVIAGFFIIVPIVVVPVIGIVSAEVAWRLFISLHWEVQE